MRLSAYGIVLESITELDLELIRNWRNAEHVRSNMQYQHHITADMQTTWFNALDKTCNLYFVIKKDTEKIGVIHLKDIDWENKSAEAGIFIGELEHLNTLSPVLATICMMEFAFKDLNLITLKAKIAAYNLKAILFNESIGYKKQTIQLNNDFHYYETNHLLFKEATKNIRAALDKIK